MNFTDLRASMQIEKLVDHLNIQFDSKDSAMLLIVPEALKYLKTIKNGDAIPTEIIDAKPSWSPSQHDLKSGVMQVWPVFERFISPQAHNRLGHALSHAATAGKDALNAIAEQAIQDFRKEIPAIEPSVASKTFSDMMTNAGRLGAMRRQFADMQIVVNDMAAISKKRSSYDRIGFLSNALATSIKRLSKWAGAKILEAEIVFEEPLRHIVSPLKGRSTIWESLASLRKFFRNVGDTMLQWREETRRAPDRIEKAIESIHAKVYRGINDVNPDIFLWRRPTGQTEEAIKKLMAPA